MIPATTRARADAAAGGVPLVELVGPAGAGKTTVLTLLQDAMTPGEHVRTPRITRPRLRTAALALRHAGDWMPPAVRLLHAAPDVWRRDLRHLIRSRVLRAELRWIVADGPGVLILDEGPVLSLARLRRAHELTGVDALRRYLDAAIEEWGGVLDAIVYVDAPDAVLIRRINEREKPHRLKGRTDPELRAFLGWYRRHYHRLLEELASRGVQVTRVDSSQGTAADTARKVERIIARLSATLQPVERGRPKHGDHATSTDRPARVTTTMAGG